MASGAVLAVGAVTLGYLRARAPAPTESGATLATSLETPQAPLDSREAYALETHRRAEMHVDASRAMRAVSDNLIAVRDASDPEGRPATCQRFEKLGPRVAFATGPKRGVSCQPAPHVRCLETAIGFYVPVASSNPTKCSWDLWYLPRSAFEAGHEAPARFSELAEDESVTSGMFADDLDADGVVDAVVLREGQRGSRDKSVRLISATGQEIETPFAELRDVDLDGRLDGVAEFRTLLQEGDAPDASLYLRGPTFIAHRRADGTFSISDGVARSHRTGCQMPLGPLVAKTVRGELDETETARRAVCSVSNGAAPRSVQRSVVEGCGAIRHDRELCAVFEGDVEAFLTQFAQLAAWSRAAR